MLPRRLILPNNSIAHVFFRCHNRQHFLRDPEVKEFLLYVWAKYKLRYGIKIYEFNIPDNHAHLIVRASDTANLGHFMRVVNSQLARYINVKYDRDSQAIRERYKSPLVTTGRYLIGLIGYIWMNRYKVTKQSPITDLYSSSAWRYNPSCVKRLANNEQELLLLQGLLDHDLDCYGDTKQQAALVRDLLNQEMSKVHGKQEIYVHGHTIGDHKAVSFRTELLRAFRRDKVPIVSKQLLKI